MSVVVSLGLLVGGRAAVKPGSVAAGQVVVSLDPLVGVVPGSAVTGQVVISLREGHWLFSIFGVFPDDAFFFQ